MNRKTADVVASLLILGVVLLGFFSAWQSTQQRSGMGMGDGTMHAQDPIWIVFGTLLIASVLGGLYLLVRTEVLPPASVSDAGTGTATGSGIGTGTGSRGRGGPSVGGGSESGSVASNEHAPETPIGTEQEMTSSGSEASSSSPVENDDATDTDQPNSPRHSARQLLEMLPEDERRILEPVLDSPGLTQVALRDRASFSKAKISQTVSELEERGLLYRERQGRTYRVYPADELESTE